MLRTLTQPLSVGEECRRLALRLRRRRRSAARWFGRWLLSLARTSAASRFILAAVGAVMRLGCREHPLVHFAQRVLVRFQTVVQIGERWDWLVVVFEFAAD